MKTLVKVVGVTSVGVAACGFALTANLRDSDRDSAARNASVVLAVAPSQRVLKPAPMLKPAPSLPNTTPDTQHMPDIPTLDLVSTGAKGEAKPDLAGAASLAVSTKPTAVRAGPSATTAFLYGFPAGRKVRVLAHESGFAHIFDVRSGAQGWIADTALASGMLTASVDKKPEPKKPVREASAEIDPPKPVTGIPQSRRQPMLLGGGESEVALRSDDTRAKTDGGTDFAQLVRRGFGAH